MNVVLTKNILLFLFLSLSVGCTTTGDPNQGGLIGWSEKKAKDRRIALEHEAREARQRAEAAQNNQRELEKREAELTNSVEKLEIQLTELRANNVELRKAFTKLIKDQKALNKELKALKEELDHTDYEKNEEHPNLISDQLQQQNKRLNAAILLLLQQR
ncbi:hypothetical protein [Sessilibacter corallicola]|uniref:Lipoprotein n=1 Tax=Sessilibacter corallicola TaxID=2904075 RepID=A0ABQ0ADB0_9GAMM